MDVWPAGNKGEWSWPLLAAAISRSDSPQDDPVKDGRTQDLVGLGLVRTLAHAPRALLVEHRDGLRTAILVLDGVSRTTTSRFVRSPGVSGRRRFYRPPLPGQHHFTRLVEVGADFFRSDRAPWPAGRGVLIAGLLEMQFTRPSARADDWVETRGL